MIRTAIITPVAVMTKTNSLTLCDVHQHLVYGVDDGARELDDSVAMLQACIQNNTTDVICTSHVRGHGSVSRRDAYLRHIDKLREYINKNTLPLCLHTGSEIFYSEDSIEILKHRIAFPLGESDHVLLEFTPYEPYETLLRAALEFFNEGYTPVFAHVERYECLRDIEKLQRLREECGLRAQMNANTVLSSKGLFGDRFVKKLLKNDLIDFVGSDAHNTSNRSTHLREAYDILERSYGTDKAICLCQTNAGALLSK